MKAFISMWRMDLCIHPYVIRVGFYGIYSLGHIMIDWPLITCLVKRCRPETHTFYVPVGEMIIALQDVAIIFGLRRRGIIDCITMLQVSITLFYYIHIHIHNTSLVCLLFVYFVFSYGLKRDFTWDDPILGNQQHIQHL